MPNKNKKTPKRQGKRKTQGNMAEKLVRKKLKNILPEDHKISINKNAGVDLYVRNGKILNVEVKSAKEKILQKRKGEHRPKVGTFQLKANDCTDSDFFGFVIKKVDNRTKWNGESEIVFVKSKEIEKYQKRRKKLGKSDKISIHQLKKLPELTETQIKNMK